MPELPEVETVVRTLQSRLAGRTLLRVHLSRSDILKGTHRDLSAVLIARQVGSISRRAKFILIDISGGGTLAIHLGMTGRLTIEPATSEPRPHTHLQIDLSTAANSAEQLRFCDPRRFGRLEWLPAGHNDARLGPEPLTLAPRQFAACLATTRRPIKSALLDQRLIAGLGNIYVDESLHAAGINPLTRTCDLSPQQLHRLGAAIKRILLRAIAAGGSSIRDYVDAAGVDGRFQSRHRVYARTGHPCHRCHTPIARITLAGRSTHFCPICQSSAPTRTRSADS